VNGRKWDVIVEGQRLGIFADSPLLDNASKTALKNAGYSEE